MRNEVATETTMQLPMKITGVIWLVAALFAVAAFLVPMPASWQDGALLYYGILSLTFGFVTLHIGSVILFLMGLGSYKKGLRRAYIIICSSIVILAIGTLQLPIISALNLWSSTWVTHGYVGMAFILAELNAYFGVWDLARQVGLKSNLARVWVVLPAAIILSVLTTFLPHVVTTTPEADYDVSVAVLAWGAFMYIAAAALLYRVRQHMGTHYKAAMAWLFLGFCGSCAALAFAVFATLLSNKNQDFWSVLTDVSALAAGILYVKAGLAFVKTREY
jgi:general stress protein CsbA